jgi:transmembrane sensor
MDEQEITSLLLKYSNGLCTPEECALVETWYLNQKERPLNFTIEELAQDLVEVEAKLKSHAQAPKIFHWHRAAAAAAILLFLSFGGYFLWQKPTRTQLVLLRKNDVAPAAHVATLTLSNGKQIRLLKSLNGKLAQQGSTEVNITTDSTLAYSAKAGSMAELEYNTLSTIRGQSSPYILILSDGTKVWLNAESSITFPVAFVGKERLVKITGEAYFEVVHNSAKPFRVAYNNILLEDLGTHFNINAYADEPFILTTLLEGSAEIRKKNTSIILKPGQQALSPQNVGNMKIKNTDTEESVAWKNGYFLFDNESLESVMRKISRWYNVSVVYPKGNKVIANYWGSMSRESDISFVLKKLEATNNVHFEIKNDTVRISKK